MASAWGSRSTLARKLVPRSSIVAVLTQFAGRFQCSSHDRSIAGASAQMARQTFANIRLGGVRSIAQQRIERHEDARGAESALQTVVLAERGLQRGKPIRRRRQSLDGAKLRAFGLDRKGETGAGR